MKNTLIFLFVFLGFTITIWAEKPLLENLDMPLASTEKPLASTGKQDRYLPLPLQSPELASIEKPLPPPPAAPIPTPPKDIVDELCTRATREVEADRLIIDAQKQYIANLEKQNAQFDKVMEGQNVLLKEIRISLDKANQINEKNEKIIEKYQDTLEKKDKEIANLKTEVELAKKNKCGIICQATRVVMGIGIGLLLSL